MLSFVQLLILQGGKESPQFEATFLIAAKPSEHCIATRHSRIQANAAERLVSWFLDNYARARIVFLR
jgi:hypothetical protein